MDDRKEDNTAASTSKKENGNEGDKEVKTKEKERERDREREQDQWSYSDSRSSVSYTRSQSDIKGEPRIMRRDKAVRGRKNKVQRGRVSKRKRSAHRYKLDKRMVVRHRPRTVYKRRASSTSTMVTSVSCSLCKYCGHLCRRQ